MQMRSVTPNEAGQRLDKLLFKLLYKAPKSFVYKMLRKKNITLNNKKADGSEKLSVGDEIRLWLSDETIEKFSKRELELVADHLDILFENKDILVINKAVGALSQKAAPDDVSVNEEIVSYMLRTKRRPRMILKASGHRSATGLTEIQAVCSSPEKHLRDFRTCPA